MTTSCTSATMAPIAIFHSNRKAMYSAMAASTMKSPRSAFLEISDPHVGPTSFTFTSLVAIPA